MPYFKLGLNPSKSNSSRYNEAGTGAATAAAMAAATTTETSKQNVSVKASFHLLFKQEKEA